MACVALVANTGWYLFNFRLNLARKLREGGHQVIFVSRPDQYSERLVCEGFTHAPWELDSAGMNPLAEFSSVFALRKIFKRYRAEVICSYTPKGNLYSGIASWGSDQVTLPNVSGLGRVFATPGALSVLFLFTYRIAFCLAHRVFFQNDADLELFLRHRIVTNERSERLMGSGVDLDRFQQAQLPGQEGVTFLLIARLLREKGVFEFVASAREVRAVVPKCRFLLLGSFDTGGRGSPSPADVASWEAEGLVTYLGTTDHVESVISQADCLVLPSYYPEGVPRSLLEGAACGRPCITTDLPGCRDVIDPGLSGFFCEPQNFRSLAARMIEFARMTARERQRMGDLARRRSERLFNEQDVLARYLEIIDSIVR